MLSIITTIQICIYLGRGQGEVHGRDVRKAILQPDLRNEDEEDEAPPPRDNLEGDPLAADLREELLR